MVCEEIEAKAKDLKFWIEREGFWINDPEGD